MFPFNFDFLTSYISCASFNRPLTCTYLVFLVAHLGGMNFTNTSNIIPKVLSKRALSFTEGRKRERGLFQNRPFLHSGTVLQRI